MSLPRPVTAGPKRALLRLLPLLSGFLLLSCARPALAYMGDPAWLGPFSADAKAAARGLGRGGYSVSLVAVPMAGLPSGLNASILARKEGIVALSPFLGGDIGRLGPVFPDKTFVIPGLRVPEGVKAFGSHTETGPALERLGRIAAKVVKKHEAAGICYAAAIFPRGEEGESEKEAFIRGFQAEISEISRDKLLDRSVAPEKVEAISAIVEFRSYNVKFLYLSAGAASADALAESPERGWTIAGMRLKDLSGRHPSLAASVEDDWEALGRAAMEGATAGSPPNAAVPARILRLKGDREGVFSEFTP